MRERGGARPRKRSVNGFHGLREETRFDDSAAPRPPRLEGTQPTRGRRAAGSGKSRLSGQAPRSKTSLGSQGALGHQFLQEEGGRGTRSPAGTPLLHQRAPRFCSAALL